MGFLNGASTFKSAIASLIGLADMLVGILAALAVVVFFIGLVRYIKDVGDAKGHAEGKERIIWSLIALTILFSLWGILSLLSISFFGTTTSNGNYSSSGTTGNPAPEFSQKFGGTAPDTNYDSSGRLQFTPQ